MKPFKINAFPAFPAFFGLRPGLRTPASTPEDEAEVQKAGKAGKAFVFKGFPTQDAQNHLK